MNSGIPYFTVPTIDLPGPLDLQPFGILVAIGVLFGAHLVHRRAARLGLNDDLVRGLIGWVVIAGFIGAHVFDVLAYQSDKLRTDPLLLFKLWDGISSYGGFIGGTVGFFLFARRHRLPAGPYADTIMWGLVPGFTFGRLGCTIVHDHIGAPSDGFFLATNYTVEAARRHGIEPGLHHNLGFYELLFMLVLCGLIWTLDRKPNPPGFLVAVVITFYAPVRFLMEFLRVNPAADPRYAGLTFAQWASIVTTVIGVTMLMRLRRMPEPPPTAAAAGTESGQDRAGQSKPARRGKKK